jgi:multiple sugar transport system substrate-binding protein
MIGKFYKYCPAGSLDYWADEVTNALVQDKAATGINWISRCARMDDPQTSKVIGKIHFAAAPGIPPFRGYTLDTVGGFCVSKYSKNKEEAFKLIAFLSSQEYSERFANIVLPPRASVLNNPVYAQKFRWYPAAHGAD